MLTIFSPAKVVTSVGTVQDLRKIEDIKRERERERERERDRECIRQRVRQRKTESDRKF